MILSLQGPTSFFSAARLIPRANQQTNGIELHKAQVIFERSPTTARKMIANINSNNAMNANT
ncbi:hypothetical protein DOY81_014835, partial [Sarcophaga bullata]